MNKSKKRFRSAMCTVLAFLLAIALTLVSIICVIKVTVLNAGYISHLSETSGYSKAVWQELKDEFVSYGSACNVDAGFFDAVFETIVTDEMINDYTEESITDLYNGNDSETDLGELNSKLFDALVVYAEEKGFVLDNNLEENLQNMSNEMCDIFRAYTSMYKSSYFKNAFSTVRRYMPLFKWALIGLSLFAILSVAEIRMFFAKAKNYLRYYIYATSGATLMLAVGPAIALIMKLGSRINVENASLYGIASGFINGVLYALLAAAAVMAAITVLLAVLRSVAVKKENKTE